MPTALPAEKVVTLRDGTPVRVRPIRPDDAPRLIEFHSRLSMNTTRLRFFTPMKRLSAAFADQLCTVDFKKRCAFVISSLDFDDIHAVGRYEGESRHSAEVAFVVEDSFQGKGRYYLLDRCRTRPLDGFDRLTPSPLENSTCTRSSENRPTRPISPCRANRLREDEPAVPDRRWRPKPRRAALHRCRAPHGR